MLTCHGTRLGSEPRILGTGEKAGTTTSCRRYAQTFSHQGKEQLRWIITPYSFPARIFVKPVNSPRWIRAIQSQTLPVRPPWQSPRCHKSHTPRRWERNQVRLGTAQQTRQRAAARRSAIAQARNVVIADRALLLLPSRQLPNATMTRIRDHL